MSILDKLLEKRRLKEEKKKIREELKREREKKKLEEKRKNHIKKIRSRQNKRYYNKKRKVVLKERELKGDEYAYHMIILTKNKKRIKRIGASWWKFDAIKIFEDAIQKNNQEVSFPAKVVENRKINKFVPIDYEILIIQRKPNNGENVTKLRDENGMFVENVILDNKDYIIINKHEWLIEETFNVFGYHPSKDRKNFDFIYNEIIMKNISRNNIKRIYTHQNKLIIQYDTDFDFVTCKNKDEAIRLYNALEKKVGKNKYILFTKTLNKNLSSWFINKLEEKTGRSRMTCTKTTTK